MCAGVVKNIISQYIHNCCSVHGCFLDASKAFDVVDHDILFQKLIERGLPLAVIQFLSCWYSSQTVRVRWDKSSESFSVSNGVRQGGVILCVLGWSASEVG